MDYNKYNILVFEGASTKIYAYIGAIQYMFENNILKNINTFIGTSSGSIICMLLSLGYTPNEIKNIIFHINPNDYGAGICKIIGLINVYKTFGYVNPEKYIQWIKTQIKNKTGNENTTFKELYDLTNKDLVITGTCLNKRESHFYNRFSNADMPIYKAVQISTALPFLFPPIKWDDDILVDGGILENFPIYYIKEDGSFPNSRKEIVKYNHKKHKINNKVLGIKVTSFIEKKNQFDEKINNVIEFNLNIINTLLTQIERNSIKKGYYNNTVDIIIPNNIDNFELNLSENDKMELFSLGYTFIKDFFEL